MKTFSFIGEGWEDEQLIQKRSEYPERKGITLPSLLLDAFYISGLALTLPYLFAIGKGKTVLDHFKRRWRPISPRTNDKPCLWLHGVSVGEIFSARKFVEEFTSRYPDWDLIISATTRSGVGVSKIHFRDHQVISYPFDLSFLVKRAFNYLRPDMIVIVEHDLWPNFLAEARKREVPVAIVNGRLSERSFKGYKRLARWITWPPPGVVHICVEDEFSAQGFVKLGMPSDRVRVTGNFKFDVTAEKSKSVEGFGFVGEPWVFLGASTHPGEEDILLAAFLRLQKEAPNTRLVLAPRRDDRAVEVSQSARKLGFSTQFWSQKKLGEKLDAKVLIIDTVGELGDLLSCADAVFVGGSLVPFGGHNVIEPVGAGKPVLTGPHHKNFMRVVEAFKENRALEVVSTASEVFEVLRELYRDPEKAKKMADRASRTVEERTGASTRALDALNPILSTISPSVLPISRRVEQPQDTSSRRPLPTR